MIKTANLLPFNKDETHPDFEINVKAERKGSLLSLTYRCSGDLDLLSFAEKKSVPTRLSNLWEHTCFEAFFSWGNQSNYWELNASPSGDWNLYRFDSYRSGMADEQRIQKIQCEINAQESGVFEFKVSFDLSPLMPEGAAGLASDSLGLHLGITAVIEQRDGTQSFWAIAHKGQKPDFHLSESFVLKL